jgi:hypothetical protein
MALATQSTYRPDRWVVVDLPRCQPLEHQRDLARHARSES